MSLLRRPCLRSLNAVIRGAPPKLRKDIKTVHVVHAAKKPPKTADVDFSNFKLTYPIVHTPEKITPSGWSAKPELEPEYPFFVSPTRPDTCTTTHNDNYITDCCGLVALCTQCCCGSCAPAPCRIQVCLGCMPGRSLDA